MREVNMQDRTSRDAFLGLGSVQDNVVWSVGWVAVGGGTREEGSVLWEGRGRVV